MSEQVKPKADHCPKCGAEVVNWDGFDSIELRTQWNEGHCECGCDFTQWEELVPYLQTIDGENGEPNREFHLPSPEAAAPDLVAALQALIVADDHCEWDEMREGILLARAALRKAGVE